MPPTVSRSARASSIRRSRSSVTTPLPTRTPISPRSAFATAPAATTTAVWRALARSSASRTSESPYFMTPARSACPGPGIHAPRPVLVVAVADDERERRPERAAVPQAREHLDLVRLDLLARAAPVPLLAAAEIRLDRVALEHEPGREPGDDRDERRPVRLARRDEREGHTVKPTARSGARGRPRRRPAFASGRRASRGCARCAYPRSSG